VLPRLCQAGITRAIQPTSWHMNSVEQYKVLDTTQQPSTMINRTVNGDAKHVVSSVFTLLLDPALFWTGQTSKSRDTTSRSILNARAITAVLTTAFLIKLSSYLQVAHIPHAEVILASLALLQWVWLDASLASLVVALAASVGGPLAELPFVAHHVWTYLPSAADYLPLSGNDNNAMLQYLLGEDYSELALASITGPCYFAVTMDAIACGRAFAATTTNNDGGRDDGDGKY
jgi:hypothetical protein